MKATLLALTLMLSNGLYAAIPKQEVRASKLSPILKMNASDRLEWLKSSEQNLKLMSELAFGKAYHLKDRWEALHSVVALKNKSSKESLLKASKSHEWFMRDAALKLSGKYFPNFAGRLSRKLLKDPSLIVRTSAVKFIHKNPRVGDKSLLWSSLSDSQNFRKGNSLWIRKHIVSALSDIEISSNSNIAPSTVGKFASLIEDKDIEVQKRAIRALEKINGKRLGSAKTPFEIHRKRWISWWDKNR